MPTETCKNAITAVILVGGGARRMGGEDKGLLLLQGRPLVAHVLERLRPQCGRVWINCRPHQQQYAQFGCPLLEDTLAGGLGPLAGLLAAMETADTEYVLSVPCDTPFLPADLVIRLWQQLEHQQLDLCSVSDGERTHPVILLARRQLKHSLRDYLLSGERRVYQWFQSQLHGVVDFSDQAGAFVNINTPQQLHEAEWPTARPTPSSAGETE